jgi:hypothetical protein
MIGYPDLYRPTRMTTGGFIASRAIIHARETPEAATTCPLGTIPEHNHPC